MLWRCDDAVMATVYFCHFTEFLILIIHVARDHSVYELIQWEATLRRLSLAESIPRMISMEQ